MELPVPPNVKAVPKGKLLLLVSCSVPAERNVPPLYELFVPSRVKSPAPMSPTAAASGNRAGIILGDRFSEQQRAVVDYVATGVNRGTAGAVADLERSAGDQRRARIGIRRPVPQNACSAHDSHATGPIDGFSDRHQCRRCEYQLAVVGCARLRVGTPLNSKVPPLIVVLPE